MSKKIDSSSTDKQVEEFLKNVRPLDLIVFKGGEGVSEVIMDLEKKVVGNGDVSHVEVAITKRWCSKIKTHTPTPDDELLSWGSTLSGKLNDGVNDLESGGVKFGIQIRNLEHLVKSYIYDTGANVGVCRLINNPIEKKEGEKEEEYAKRMEELKQKIDEAYEKFNGNHYDVNMLNLVAALFPALRPFRDASKEVIDLFKESNPWMFCSEFSAALYEYLGVIVHDDKVGGKVFKPEDVVPVDFLGVDEDPDGITKPICEIPPIWVKKIVEK